MIRFCLPALAIALSAAACPPLDDPRTPDQIKDFDEHYIELAKHYDEINAGMVILHAEEEAAKAAGMHD